MATPYDLYIRFLLTTGVKDIDDVVSKFVDLNLSCPTTAQIDEQEDIISEVLPRTIAEQVSSKKYEGDFLRYMKVLEVDDLWYYEKPFRDKNPVMRTAVKLTYDLHQDEKMRLCVSALLIKAMPATDIAQLLASRFASFIREEHVVLYNKYFFNVKRMTKRDWKNHLMVCDPHVSHLYFTALIEPIDVLKTELELPAKVSSGDTLQYLLSKSFSKAKAALAYNTPEGAKEARFWIETTVQLVDKYEKYRSGDASDFSNALQLEFDYVDTEFSVPDNETLAEIQAAAKKIEEDSKNNADSKGGGDV